MTNRRMLYIEIKAKPCPCKDEACDKHGLTLGAFDQGNGWKKDVAERFAALWNNARDINTQHLRPQAELEDELMSLRISLVRLAQQVGTSTAELGIDLETPYVALREKARHTDRGWNKLVAQIMVDLENKRDVAPEGEL